MELLPYLAMTPAEIRSCPSLPEKLCYMACHFSPYGTGLSGIPKELPPDSLLMVTDRTPICGHDPQLIRAQLEAAIELLSCKRIVLDLQRPGQSQTVALIAALSPLDPVVSACYAENSTGAVLLPPPPLWTDPEKYLRPWQGRELWLEAVTESAEVTVTREASTYTPCPWQQDETFCEEKLHIRYTAEVSPEAIRFRLSRGKEQVYSLLQEMAPFGIHGAIGLYQQLG